jgi:hypothetical protein
LKQYINKENTIVPWGIFHYLVSSTFMYCKINYLYWGSTGGIIIQKHNSSVCWGILFRILPDVVYFDGHYRDISLAVSSVLLNCEINCENHWPAASHWQTLLHNVLSSTPHHERDSNSQCWWRGSIFIH